MKKVIILGGKGNGSVIANAILDSNKFLKKYEFCGYLNDRLKVGSMIEKYPVIDVVANIEKYLDEYYFINTILRIDGNIERINMIKSLNVPDNKFLTFVHPSSYIAPNVKLSHGVVIMPNVSISSNTRIGMNTLVMVGATIGHDNAIESYCHIAAQACVGAYLKVEEGVHIGLNATIRENLVIKNNATIGMGTVLLNDVGENEIWVGNPGKFLRYSKRND